jgi:hypothetical protein
MSEPEKPSHQDLPAQALLVIVASSFVVGGTETLIKGEVRLAVVSYLAGAAFFTASVFWRRLSLLVGPRISHTAYLVTTDFRWWMAAAFLLLLYVGYPSFMDAYGLRTPEKATLPRAADTAVAVHPALPPANPSPAGTAEKQERVMLEVDAVYLSNIYQDRTTLEGDRIFSVYAHKWMKVSGKAYDVAENLLGNHTYTVYIKISKSGSRDVSSALQFGSQWSSQISALPYGRTISALCSVVSASGFQLVLDDCELIDDSPH